MVWRILVKWNVDISSDNDDNYADSNLADIWARELQIAVGTWGRWA